MVSSVFHGFGGTPSTSGDGLAGRGRKSCLLRVSCARESNGAAPRRFDRTCTSIMPMARRSSGWNPDSSWLRTMG